MRIRLPNNWQPRPYQLNLWSYLERGGKRAYEIAHRRWGKDDVCLHYAATAALQRPANYWHMLPEAAQARKAIWDAVNPRTGIRRIDEAFPAAIRATTREHEMMIRFVNGATWQVVGSDNYNSLVGSPPAGVVFSEWALAKPQSWGYIKPILDDNDGWALFITTPRGNNHAKSMFDMANSNPSWFCELQTARTSGLFSIQQLDEIRAEYVATYGQRDGVALYEQEYECSFDAAIGGTYYAEFIRKARQDGRVTRIPIESKVPVNTFWDLGMNDTTAIWFHQRVGPENRFIDYYECHGVGLDHYARVLQEKGYVYGDHYFPHDVEVRELTSGKSRIEVLRNLKVTPAIVVERIRHINEGIQMVRDALPSCWFDAERCEFGIQCLENYRQEYDDDKKCYKPRPLHDWSSNGSDAFRQFAQGYRTGGGWGSLAKNDISQRRKRQTQTTWVV